MKPWRRKKSEKAMYVTDLDNNDLTPKQKTK